MAVLDYRETKTYVVRVEEAVTQTLDDHIVMTQVCVGWRGGRPHRHDTGVGGGGTLLHTAAAICRDTEEFQGFEF